MNNIGNLHRQDLVLDSHLVLVSSSFIHPHANKPEIMFVTFNILSAYSRNFRNNCLLLHSACVPCNLQDTLAKDLWKVNL